QAVGVYRPSAREQRQVPGRGCPEVQQAHVGRVLGLPTLDGLDPGLGRRLRRVEIGLPAERSITSSPAALRRCGSWLIATVSDGLRWDRFSESDRSVARGEGAEIRDIGLASKHFLGLWRS